MGLLSLFRKGPLSADKIDKIAKLAANPFAQPDVRMREMERLVDEGSEASLRGVLRRFASNAQGHIADEDEKKWLRTALVDLGEPALGSLEDYIRSESKLTYALRAYADIVGPEKAASFFLEVLEHYGADDYRSDEAKLQLVLQLSDAAQDAAVLRRLLPFLRDHSDDVQWAVLEIVQSTAQKPQAPSLPALQAAFAEALPILQHLLTDTGTSARIARRTAELLAEQGWALGENLQPMHALLEDAFFVDKKKIVRRRVKK
jgi:hypothetical protein